MSYETYRKKDELGCYRTSCKYSGYSLCGHPAIKRELGYATEDILELNNCPDDDYIVIGGIAVDRSLVERYIQHIKDRLHSIELGLVVNSQILENEREKLHYAILEDAQSERGSKFDIELSEYITIAQNEHSTKDHDHE